MIRKDCDNPVRIARGKVLLLVLSTCFAGASSARAGSLRLWPKALVVHDSIRVDDVCEVTGFEVETGRKIAKLIIAGAPPAGGVRRVSIDLVRSVVRKSGTNMARLTIVGATACEVSRPSLIAPDRPSVGDDSRFGDASGNAGKGRNSDGSNDDAPVTLRQAVIDFCNARIARLGGTAEVTFDHTSDRLLELAEPEYTFKVRSQEPKALGLVPLEVDVLSKGRLIQTVTMIVQVIMDRSVLVARRTINQGASISAKDLELVDLSFNRAEAIGLVDATQAIGQRARRLIPSGTAIQSDMLEPVPVVRRGQLVTLTSVAGVVQIVTTAKAGADGLLGDVIKVRSVEDRRVEYDAIVTGPGQVRVGSVRRQHNSHVALGGGS